MRLQRNCPVDSVTERAPRGVIRRCLQRQGEPVSRETTWRHRCGELVATGATPVSAASAQPTFDFEPASLDPGGNLAARRVPCVPRRRYALVGSTSDDADRGSSPGAGRGPSWATGPAWLGSGNAASRNARPAARCRHGEACDSEAGKLPSAVRRGLGSSASITERRRVAGS
jgi:hypothetical protein